MSGGGKKKRPPCQSERSRISLVSPWGVEPQSLEPESNILSIELRRHLQRNICALRCAKLIVYLYFCKSIIENYITDTFFMNVKIEDSWREALAAQWDMPYFKALTDFVRAQYAATTVYPPASKIFAAFDACPFNQVKVVIIGQDPYHGPGQANGLCFSVNPGVPFPPSLVNIFKEVAADTGAAVPADGDLSRWARQGVFMLNSVLTVEQGRAASHASRGWETLTDAAISALSERRDNLVFLLWGSYAINKGKLIDRNRHLVLTSVHPSPLSAHRGFFGNRHFSQANAYLQSHNITPIEW